MRASSSAAISRCALACVVAPARVSATVARVRPAGGEAVALEAVDGLARAADGDRQAAHDVMDAAVLHRGDDRQRLGRAQPDAKLGAQPGLDGVPQLDLQAHEIGEQGGQVGHDGTGDASASRGRWFPRT
jgi:hypothetical protein